jgi:hypothetical protein
MEGWAAGQGAEAVARGFVAAFCQANVGDTSPNTLGPVCLDTGEPCDAVHSTCGGRVQQCIGRGPGWPDHFESTRLIGAKQADKAQQLWEQAPSTPGEQRVISNGVCLPSAGRPPLPATSLRAGQ